MPAPKRKFTTWVAVFFVILILLTMSIVLIEPVRYQTRTVITTIAARASAPAAQPFPEITNTDFSETQQRIIKLAQAEYANRPVSYDAHVIKYTDGVNEAWCADFASWIMKEAGVPFTNPHSGGWRIPGVYTLQEYFESIDKFIPSGHYIPKSGDIAFLHGPGGHVAIVLEVKEGHMVTIGGNENGRMRIVNRSLEPGAEGLIGFGALSR